MIKYKRYERYKDSGVEWIGEIPEEWDVLKLKWIFKLVYRYPTYYGIQYSDNGVIEVRGEMLKGNGLIDVESCEPRFISEEISNNYPMTKLKKDDIVMSVRGTMGKIGLVTDNIENANITANLLRLSPNKNKVYSKWLVWLMESSRFNEELDNYSDQTTIKTIRVPNLLSINIPLPKYDEQNAIANFLDQKTAEIDGLIADKEKLIELLQEKRQAIITEAVTKGLNPNVRMKDSGIEWIGEIPEEWELIKIKFVGTIYSGNGFKEELQGKTEGDYPFFKVSDINGNGKLAISSNNYVDEDDVVNNGWNIIPKNSILFPKIGEALKKNHRKINACSCLIDNNIAAIKTNERIIDFNYFYYYFCCVNAEWFVNPGAVPSINNAYLKNFMVLLPSKNEQTAIANFLDQKTAEIDDLIFDIYTQIQKLKEYRQSLISEAVTGKIDVREFGNMSEVIYYEQNNSPCSEFTHAAE